VLVLVGAEMKQEHAFDTRLTGMWSRRKEDKVVLHFSQPRFVVVSAVTVNTGGVVMVIVIDGMVDVTWLIATTVSMLVLVAGSSVTHLKSCCDSDDNDDCSGD
jgi:vacuolar-type H+-ATPase subunit I/STV1